MSKPIKISIFDTSTRTAVVKYVSPKHMIGPTAFRLPKTEEVYFVDPAYAITTITKKFTFPLRYTTYYYKRNVPKPVDWPNIHGGQSLVSIQSEDEEVNEQLAKNQSLLDSTKSKEPKDLKGIKNGLHLIPMVDFVQDKQKNGLVLLAERPIQTPAFENWKYTEITSMELGQLLNPAFFSMIAKSNKDKRGDIQWYIQLGTAAGVGFIIYYMLQSLIPGIIHAMQKAGFT